MRVAQIKRFGNDDEGSPGRLTTPGFKAFSLELPWRDNQPEISCLPEGVYFVRWTYSSKFRRFMYAIEEQIPNRGGFRIHSGNFAGDKAKGFRADSLGCPLLGYQFGKLDGQRAVLVSRPAVADFVTHMQMQPFTLEIS